MQKRRQEGAVEELSTPTQHHEKIPYNRDVVANTLSYVPGEAMKGVLGESVTTEEGKRCAAQTAFNILATLRFMTVVQLSCDCSAQGSCILS